VALQLVFLMLRDLYDECQEGITTMPEPVWIDALPDIPIKKEIMIKIEAED
jgi:hypothetical protein